MKELRRAKPKAAALDVKTLRRRLGLTQEDLARTLGVSWETVSRWENGRTRPSRLALRAIQDLERSGGPKSK